MRPIKRQIFDDRLYLWRKRTAQKPYFHGGIETPSLGEHLQSIDFALPDLPKKGRAPFAVATFAGEFEAAVHVVAWAPRGAPAIIHHHDAGEVPVTQTIEKIFPKRAGADLTILVVEAPFHGNAQASRSAGATLHTYLAMQAVAIAATERLLASAYLAEARVCAVTGFGQGGYIANRHHVLYNSADLYLPFMAGVAQAEPFLSSLPTAWRARHNPQALRAQLNFEDAWAARSHPNVFPVLGTADLVNRFDEQARAYGDTPIEVWPISHRALAGAAQRVRDKITRHVLEAIEDASAGERARPGAREPRRLARG